ncbi:MAG: hypothetical protein HUU37_00320 [Bdellovibrionales bacterium]|nr:hypothetical protein [Bdellovibrionales bacterium]
MGAHSLHRVALLMFLVAATGEVHAIPSATGAVETVVVKRKRRALPLRRLAPTEQSETRISSQPNRWEEKVLNETSLDDLYTKDVTNNIRSKYQAEVAPAERSVESPYRRARPWEVDRYNQNREELAKFTTKEVLSQRLKTIFNGADKTSGAMKVAQSVKNVMAADMKEEEQPPKAPKKAPMVSSSASARAEEAPIPTRLKTKFNFVHGRGQVRFTNPIVSTSVNLDVSGKAADKVIVNLDKKIKPLDMESSVNYAATKKVVAVNLKKAITKEISADVQSAHQAGDGQFTNGAKSQESVRMTYSVSF